MQAAAQRVLRYGDISHDLASTEAAISPIRAKSMVRVGGGTADQQFRPRFFGFSLELVVVDLFSFAVHAVVRDLVINSGKVERMSVRQMPPVRQFIPRIVSPCLARSSNCHVRLRTGVWLHIGVLGPEYLFRPVDRELLGNVREFASSVVPLAR